MQCKLVSFTSAIVFRTTAFTKNKTKNNRDKQLLATLLAPKHLMFSLVRKTEINGIVLLFN